MAKLDRIVNVQIALNTTAIKQQTFSDILLLAPHALSVNRVLTITESDELLAMGVAPSDPLYLAAADVFSQIPTVTRLFIGRQAVDAVPLTVTGAAEVPMSVTIAWRDASKVRQVVVVPYTPGAGATPSTIATAVAALVEATAAPVEATAAGAVFTIEPSTPGDSIAVTVSGNLSIGALSSTEAPAVSLGAVRTESDDWYGIVSTARDVPTVLAIADWAEANGKLFGTASADENVLDAASDTDIAAVLQQRQQFRTFVEYSASAATEWPEAAIMAKSFTIYPGGETWALKRLAGISYDVLREDQALAAFSKNANTFEQFRNFAVTQGGKVAAGEWIDTIRFRDWLVEEIKVSVVSAMINAEGKVPYTDAGIQIIVTAMQKALDLGVARGGIAPPEQDAEDEERVIPSYTVRFPRSQAVSFNNKANRLLQDVGFTARLAGAIHTVEIKGALSYAL